MNVCEPTTLVEPLKIFHQVKKKEKKEAIAGDDLQAVLACVRSYCVMVFISFNEENGDSNNKGAL